MILPIMDSGYRFDDGRRRSSTTQPAEVYSLRVDSR